MSFQFMFVLGCDMISQRRRRTLDLDVQYHDHLNVSTMVSLGLPRTENGVQVQTNCPIFLVVTALSSTILTVYTPIRCSKPRLGQSTKTTATTSHDVSPAGVVGRFGILERKMALDLTCVGTPIVGKKQCHLTTADIRVHVLPS
jgi:hypothetical protein